MAESREWTEWHLTPRGWEHGAWQLDGPSDLKVPPPANRVLTYEYEEEISSPFSGMSISHREIWRGSNAAWIEELLAKWGAAPRKLYIP
jgi:hypothetical protein